MQYMNVNACVRSSNFRIFTMQPGAVAGKKLVELHCRSSYALTLISLCRSASG